MTPKKRKTKPQKVFLKQSFDYFNTVFVEKKVIKNNS